MNKIVVLLHGLGRTSRSMKKLAKSLLLEDFTVINIDYPSTKHSINDLATIVFDKLSSLGVKFDENTNFVTHSLGGIVLRAMIEKYCLSGLGRVVMLGPPNHGSEIVDHLKSNLFFKKLFGPAGKELGTDEKSVPNELGPVGFDLGIIAGNNNYGGLLAGWVAKPNDGKVSVESTKVVGMKDFIVLPYIHSFIMSKPEVIKYTIHFLKFGKFV